MPVSVLLCEGNDDARLLSKLLAPRCQVGGATIFAERILVGIGNATGNLGDWLPEWRALQEAIDGAS